MTETYRRRDLRDHPIPQRDPISQREPPSGKDLAKAVFNCAGVQSVDVHPRTPHPGEVTLKITADEGLRGYVERRVRELLPPELRVHVEYKPPAKWAASPDQGSML